MAMETLRRATAVDEQVSKVVSQPTKHNQVFFLLEILRKNNLVDQEKSNLHSLPTVDSKFYFCSVYYAFFHVVEL
jgi:hypothetical protein